METVHEMMTEQVDSCSLLDNVYEVAVKMKDLNVGAIPIVDEDKLVGMITDRDIVLRCIAEKKPASSKVEEIMSNDLITIKKDTAVHEAARLMAEHQIRRLPVIDNDDKLVGIVSLGDFAVHHLTNEHAGDALSEISQANELQ